MGDKDTNMSKMNVQVAVRVRPLNQREKDQGVMHVVTTDLAHNKVRVKKNSLDRTYQYDKVFGPYTAQAEIFSATVEPIVKIMMKGYSTTCFAYGQTGTGKTFTMEGNIQSQELMGVIPRSVHCIFEQLESMAADYTVR
ncbi:unnamed protein product [Chrysoparadoxa australica]